MTCFHRPRATPVAGLPGGPGTTAGAGNLHRLDGDESLPAGGGPGPGGWKTMGKMLAVLECVIFKGLGIFMLFLNEGECCVFCCFCFFW